MRDNWEDLANAIVVQAANDYRRALRVLKAHSSYAPAAKVKTEVEQFFRSEWYRSLSSVDGEVLIKRLNAEV